MYWKRNMRTTAKIMSEETYKATRSWENVEKRLYNGCGKYNIPVIQPTQNKNVECDFIGFNYAKGCKEPEKKGVHFFLDDYQIQRTWTRVDTYTKLLARFQAVLSPDFSLYADFHIALQIYNHYRKQWLSAYWQEHGVNVIPSVNWSTPESYEFCFDGIPKNTVVAICTTGTQKNQQSKEWFKMGYDEMLERLQPTEVLICGIVPEGLDGNIRQIENFGQRRFKK